MATVDVSSLTAEQRIKLANELAAFQERDSKLSAVLAAFREQLAEIGASIEDAIRALTPVRRRGPKPGSKRSGPARKRGAKGSRVGSAASADGTGARPVPGTTYVHPDTGATWTKNASGLGAAKKEFVDLVRAGHTWVSLAQAGGAPRGRKAAGKKVARKRGGRKAAAA